ncbi:MAG: hypothetical protein CL780_05370 [Chloroflexi bacterium]|nr:hypothetical protein [Chloroflexota bacterium]
MEDFLLYIHLIRDVFIILFSLVGTVVFILIFILVSKIYKQSNKIITRLEKILNNIESLVKSSDVTLRNLRNTIRSVRVSMSAGYLFSQFLKRLGKFLK